MYFYCWGLPAVMHPGDSAHITWEILTVSHSKLSRRPTSNTRSQDEPDLQSTDKLSLCVSDSGEQFFKQGASSVKISQLSEINHCNSNFFACATLVVESGVITVTVKKSMKSITHTELWSFKQNQHLQRFQRFDLYLQFSKDKDSTNLCKSFSCSVYLFMAYCSTRLYFFLERRWHLSLQSVPWTVPGASFIKLLQDRWLRNKAGGISIHVILPFWLIPSHQNKWQKQFKPLQIQE